MAAWRWAIAAVFLLPTMVRADQTAAQKFATVLQDSSHHATVIAAAKATPAWAATGCSTAKFNEAPEIGIYLPLQFDSTGEPVAGEWREGLIATGCGVPITLNVLTQVTAPGTLSTGPLLPGGTIADPALQNAAQPYAVAAAGGVPTGCKTIYVENTVFITYEGTVHPAPWKEDWTLNFCGTAKTISLHFIPDALGTKINTDPNP